MNFKKLLINNMIVIKNQLLTQISKKHWIKSNWNIKNYKKLTNDPIRLNKLKIYFFSKVFLKRLKPNKPSISLKFQNFPLNDYLTNILNKEISELTTTLSKYKESSVKFKFHKALLEPALKKQTQYNDHYFSERIPLFNEKGQIYDTMPYPYFNNLPHNKDLDYFSIPYNEDPFNLKYLQSSPLLPPYLDNYFANLKKYDTKEIIKIKKLFINLVIEDLYKFLSFNNKYIPIVQW